MQTVNCRTAYFMPEVTANIPGFPDCKVVGYIDPTRTAPFADRAPRTSLDCDIIITTVDRAAVSSSQNHIKECLEPIKNRVVHIMPDCEQTGYIGDVQDNIQVHPWTDLQMFRQRTLRKGARAAYNYCRCLMHSKRDALIIEDDTVLDDDWESKVLSALSRIADDRFILAVHQNWEWAINAVPRLSPGDRVTQFVSPVILNGAEPIVSHWAGTNAVYYPRSVLASLGRSILDELNTNPSSHSVAYDMLVSKWCYVFDVPVYLMTPSIARNVGTVTSIEWNGACGLNGA